MDHKYGQYTCTAATLWIDKMKKLVKKMKQVKMINLLIMRLFGSLEHISQFQATKELLVSLRLPRTGISLILQRYFGQP